MMKQTQYAWAAGFFDGEGCVSLHTVGRYTSLRVIVVQKDIRPLEQFRSIFELQEKIGVVTRTTFKRPYYRLVVSGQSAANVLTLMLPYLTLKREVAEVGLNYQAAVNSYSPKERSAGLPLAEIEYRKTLTQKAKWLNTGRWAAATTKPSGPGETPVCDSLNCTDEKRAEVAETTTRLQ